MELAPAYNQTVADDVVVYLGLGSNLGDRVALLAAAVSRLEKGGLVREVALSSCYETDAVPAGGPAQPAYLNAVARAVTLLSAEDLLDACLRIEAALGRARPVGQVKAARS